MDSLSAFAKAQYQLVKESRNVFFTYCKTISPADFTNQNSSFGRGGSIRNLLVHVANVYEFWVANNGLGEAVSYSVYESFTTIEEVIKLYDTIDSYVDAFIDVLDNADKEIKYEINCKKGVLKPLPLFTHVITHEFHHKGQVLSLSRHLGYTPVDTDIIR